MSKREILWKDAIGIRTLAADTASFMEFVHPGTNNAQPMKILNETPNGIRRVVRFQCRNSNAMLLPSGDFFGATNNLRGFVLPTSIFAGAEMYYPRIYSGGEVWFTSTSGAGVAALSVSIEGYLVNYDELDYEKVEELCS